MTATFHVGDAIEVMGSDRVTLFGCEPCGIRPFALFIGHLETIRKIFGCPHEPHPILERA